MKSVLLALLLMANVSIYGVSLRMDGENGWVARITFENPNTVTLPVFFLVIGPGNVPNTNTEAILDAKTAQSIRMNLPDGTYRYVFLDGSKKNLGEGRFDLKTPFRFTWKKIQSQSAEFEIVPDSRQTVRLTLAGADQPDRVMTYSLDAATNVVINGLKSLSRYRVELVSGNYRRDGVFETQARNVALGKPVAGTFTRLPESRFVDDTTSVITRVNDGKWEWFRGTAFTSEVGDREQFVYINLERSERIRTIRTVWHSFYCPASYFFVYGRDGKAWNVVKRDMARLTNRVAPDNTPIRVDSFPTNITALFIGVVIRKGTRILGRYPDRNFAGLMELEAYE